MALRKEKREELYEAFLMNCESGNKLRVQSVGDVVRSVGCSPRQSELMQIEKDYTSKGINYVDFEQVVKLATNPSWVPESMDSLKDAFSTFDKDGNGFVSAAELRHVLTSMGEKLRDEDVDEMIREVDLTGDGQINIEVLTKALLMYIDKFA